MGSAGANSLQAYGLSFDALNILLEYGLIIPEYNSTMDYKLSVLHKGKLMLPMSYQNAHWALVPKGTSPEPPELQPFLMSGVALSRSGRELLSIVDIAPNEQYTVALKDFLDKQGMTMTPVTPST
jgi:hypothetical protein